MESLPRRWNHHSLAREPRDQVHRRGGRSQQRFSEKGRERARARERERGIEGSSESEGTRASARERATARAGPTDGGRDCKATRVVFDAEAGRGVSNHGTLSRV